MDIQVLTEFQLKMTMIDEYIAKKLIFVKIELIFGPSLAEILSKIAKFRRMIQFYDVYNENTSTGQDW